MTAHEFDRDFAITAKEERKITQKLVEKIAFCEHKLFYAELGFASVMDWLMRGHKYAKTSAWRRWQAARLVTIVPEANDLMVEGSVNVTTLAALQSAIKQEENRTNQKISHERKEQLVQKIADQTCEQSARVIAIEFPELSFEQKETVRPVGATETKLTLIFSEADMAILNRVKEVASHSNFNASWSELIIVAAKEFLKQKDAMLKKPKSQKTGGRLNQKSSAAEQFGSPCSKNSEPLSYATEMQIRRRDGDECTFVDPISGTKCGSRMQIEVDHIVPRALGGSNDPENLRCLCRTHNGMMAVHKFGAKFMRERQTRRLQ